VIDELLTSFLKDVIDRLPRAADDPPNTAPPLPPPLPPPPEIPKLLLRVSLNDVVDNLRFILQRNVYDNSYMKRFCKIKYIYE
jgi:hypothetical protein